MDGVWTRGRIIRIEFIIWKKIDVTLLRPSAPRGAAQRSEENKTNVEALRRIAFHKIVNRQRWGGSPWPLASSERVPIVPESFYGFWRERTVSRCVNHETVRRFHESHPLPGETKSKGTGMGFVWKANPFYGARIHTLEGRRSESYGTRCARDPLRVPLQSHCGVTRIRGKQRVAFRFSENRGRERLSPLPSIATSLVSNVKHCNLNMDKARCASFIRDIKINVIHVCYAYSVSPAYRR